jgi:hypothetical protein
MINPFVAGREKKTVRRKSPMFTGSFIETMAEREGFEPSVPG